MSESIYSGWDVAAQSGVDLGLYPSLEEARERVAMDWLLQGDTRPFADWVRRGWNPPRSVLLLVAEMTEPRSENSALIGFVLEVKRRPGSGRGRPVEPEVRVRDALLGGYIRARMDEGYSYDAARAEVREIIEKEGGVLGSKTIRNAYDHRQKQRRSKSRHQRKGK